MRQSKTPSPGSDRARKRRKAFLKRVKRDFNSQNKGLALFIIGVTAFFGAGLVDIYYPDVIPLRPYSGIFVAGLAVRKHRNTPERLKTYRIGDLAEAKTDDHNQEPRLLE